MVLTRQQARTHKHTEKTPSSTGNGDEYEGQTPDPKKAGGKKRAGTMARGKQRQTPCETAKVSRFLNLPLDILYEIFSFAHPGDLMQISWTSKTLNRFLTTSSSRHVWQAAFKTIPEAEKPPPCPSEITEIAYTKLLYSQLCMMCAKARPLIRAWGVFVKACQPCIEKIAVSMVRAGMFWPDSAPLGPQVLPGFGKDYDRMALFSDSKRFEEEIATTVYDLREREIVIKKWKSRVREREKFSNAMNKLENLMERTRENARADILKRRIDCIWEKLSEEGWREEIAARKSVYERGLLGIDGVRMFCPLGDEVWEKLRGPLHGFMRKKSETVRSESRIDKIQKIVDSFYNSLPHPHDFHPSVADVCWIPEVQRTIISGTGEEFDACEADTRARLPELSATWLQERRNFFLTLLPRGSSTVEHLSLATTIFDCMKCKIYGMCIEKALLHACRIWGQDYLSERRFKEIPGQHIARVFCDKAHSSWDSGYSEYRYSEGPSRHVREIVLECGEDPDTITTKEMNDKHLRFACFQTNGTIRVRSWYEVLRSRVEGTAARSRFLQACELPEYRPDPGEFEARAGWSCLRCWGVNPGWRLVWPDTLKGHLKDSHGVDNPTEEDCYHEDPNHTPFIAYKPTDGA